jgi:hypothetical protein
MMRCAVALTASTSATRRFARVSRVDNLFWYAIGAVDWASYPTLPASQGGPSNSVPAALHRIDEAADDSTVTTARHYALDAVGNDAGGRLFPVLLPAMPFLLQIAVEGGPWSRDAALQVVSGAIDRAPDAVEPESMTVARPQLLRLVRPWRRRVEALDVDEQPERIRANAHDLIALLDH